MPEFEQGDGHLVAVVEDNERNARLVHDVLVAHGYRVTVYSTGRDALSGIPGERPDVVLLDVQLPDIDGIEVLEALRRTGVDVPAVAVTALAMAGDRESLLASGFDDYLAKPIEVGSLAARVASAIENGRHCPCPRPVALL